MRGRRVETSGVGTGYAVITTALHVERSQILSQALHKLEQPLPHSVDQHVVLGVQLSRTADQTTQKRVNPTCSKTTNHKDDISSQNASLPLCGSPSKTTLQGVKKDMNRGTLGKRGCSL